MEAIDALVASSKVVGNGGMTRRLERRWRVAMYGNGLNLFRYFQFRPLAAVRGSTLQKLP
jgi:hypothetical protein